MIPYQMTATRDADQAQAHLAGRDVEYLREKVDLQV
jgi:hypothetical protein